MNLSIETLETSLVLKFEQCHYILKVKVVQFKLMHPIRIGSCLGLRI